MKFYILVASLLALAACDSAAPQNNVQDVAANNMIADDVTELQDDSAAAPEAEVDTRDGGNAATEGNSQAR